MASFRPALVATLTLALLPALPAAATGADDLAAPRHSMAVPAPDGHERGPQPFASTSELGVLDSVGAAARTRTVPRPEAAARAAQYLASYVDERPAGTGGHLNGREAYLTVMALVAVGGHEPQVAAVLDALEPNAPAFAGGPYGGQFAADVVLAAVAGGRDPRAFGGVNLLEGILTDLRDDGRCGSTGSISEQSACLLALQRAGEPVPQTALDVLVQDADPVTGGFPDGGLGLVPGADALTALAALDGAPGARGAALGARDLLVLSLGQDRSNRLAGAAAAATALDLVGEDTSGILQDLADAQLPDGSLPSHVDVPAADLEGTALAALAFLGESPASAGPGGTDLVDYRAHPFVERVNGADRYWVAAEIARSWTQGAETVFVVSGETFPDALSASALASYYGGPILLTRKDRLPEITAGALDVLAPADIVILGGPSTITTAVEDKLAAHASAGVHRIEGKDRYAVSAATAYHWEPGRHGAFVATGANWPDGLTGGALAGALGDPLLLTKTTSVPPPVLQALRDLRPTSITILGGTNSVTAAVVEQLREVAPVRRIEGKDRYEVARNVAAEMRLQGLPGQVAYTATGLNWPDALAGSALAGALGAPVLLLRPDVVPAPTLQALTAQGPEYVGAFGGPTTIQPGTLTQIRLLPLVR